MLSEAENFAVCARHDVRVEGREVRFSSLTELLEYRLVSMVLVLAPISF